MKRKLVSSILSVALLLTASKTFADDPPPPPDDGEPAPALVQACYVVVIGGIVAVGLWKLCKSIPDPTDIPNQYPKPPTNPPPVINPTNNTPPPTNAPPKPPWWKRPFASLTVGTNALATHAIGGLGYVDGSGRPYESLVNYELQSSTNAVDWRTELTATGWVSSGAAFFAYYSNGVPLHTTYSDSFGQTNYIPWNLGDGDESMKMFRLLSVH